MTSTTDGRAPRYSLESRKIISLFLIIIGLIVAAMAAGAAVMPYKHGHLVVPAMGIVVGLGLILFHFLIEWPAENGLVIPTSGLAILAVSIYGLINIGISEPYANIAAVFMLALAMIGWGVWIRRQF